MTNVSFLEPKKRFSDGLTGYHYLVLVVACLGWSFDTMDQWLFVFAKQHAIRELLGPLGSDTGLVTKYTNIATAALMIGWATGGLLFGMVGDRLGRTKTMGLTILLYAMFTGLSGLAQNVTQFAALRFLTGLGVGGEFAAGAALVAEAFPAHARATALGIVQATSALGNVLAALINLGFASAGWDWRWLFGVGVLPALLLVVIFAFIHEPEAWVHARAQAKKGGGNYGSIFALFREPILRRNTIIGMLLAAVGVIGFWGVGVLTPELLRGVLNPTADPVLKKAVELQVSYAGMAQNFGSFFGALGFAYIAQRFGRRIGFVVAFVGCIVMVPVTFFCTSSFATALVLFFGLGFMLLFVMGGFAVYFPELFPTRLRSTGTGFCYNVARFITAGTLFATAPLVASLGIAGMVGAVMCVYVMGLVVLKFAPETKGQPLPE